MKATVTSMIVIFVSSVLLFSESPVQSEKDSKRYIVESERNWAESVATGDTSGI